jgi:hypothetical protein
MIRDFEDLKQSSIKRLRNMVEMLSQIKERKLD